MKTPLAIILLCTASGNALAQTTEPGSEVATAEPASPEEGGEIIVTAQKRSERVNDVPLAISAFTGDQLTARGITETAQLERIVPGFTVQKTYLGQPVFYLRGIGFSDASVSASPTVSVYTDEIPLPYSAMARGAAMDLARVEVLKGPQGTLFGQNSTGGAVNYIVAKPGDKLEMGADASFGRFSAFDASGFVSGPLSPTIGARLAVQTQLGGDWQRSVSRGEKRGDREFYNGRLVVDFTPSDILRFNVIAQAWQDNSDTQAPQFTLFSPARTGPAANQPVIAALSAEVPTPRTPRAADWDANSPTERDDRFYQLALRGELDIGEIARLTSITAYNNLRTYSPIDLEGTTFTNGFYEPIASAKTFSQELRLDGEIGDRVKWLAGVNYQHANTNEVFQILINSTPTGPLFYTMLETRNHQKIDTYAGFGSLDFELTDTLTARASARYTDENRDFSGCTADGGDGVAATAFSATSRALSGQNVTIGPGQCVTLDDVTRLPVPTVLKQLDENNFSWRVGLDWKVNPDTLLYGTVAKGYKSGAFSGIVALFASQVTPVTQESVVTYELGLKASMFDRRLQVNTAAFYYDYVDKQLQGFILTGLGPFTALRNIPKSRIAGAEFDLTARPTEGLRVQLSGIYLDTKVQKNPDQPRDPFGVLTSFVGESFPFTPKYQATADIEQRFPVSGTTEGYVGASAVYHSSASASFGRTSSPLSRATFTIDDYTLFDARAGLSFDDGRIVAEIWGRNIFNKYYVTNITRIIDTVPRYVGMPATYGVRVSWRL